MTTWTEAGFNTTTFTETSVSDPVLGAYSLMIDDTYFLLIDETYTLEIQSAAPGTSWVQPNIS